MRMIAKWSKTGSAIYSSHLDMQRAFQMWFSRAGIPIRYSQGFNPHPVLSFASALSLGMESHGEYADMALAELIPETVFLTKMKEHAPPGLEITGCTVKDDTFPSLTGLLRLAAYDIDCKDWEIRQDSCVLAAKRIMGSSSYEAVRRTKSGEKKEDIRPMIHSLEIVDGIIHTTLSCSSQATLAPQVLAEAITREASIDVNASVNTPSCLHIIRRELLFAVDGEIKPLL